MLKGEQMCARPMLLFGDRVLEVLNGEQKQTYKQTKNWGGRGRGRGGSTIRCFGSVGELRGGSGKSSEREGRRCNSGSNVT